MHINKKRKETSQNALQTLLQNALGTLKELKASTFTL